MTRVTVGEYATASGKIGVRVQCDEKGRYSYTGEWGAGSGHSFATMQGFLNSMLREHPRHSITLNFWENATP